MARIARAATPGGRRGSRLRLTAPTPSVLPCHRSATQVDLIDAGSRHLV